MQDPPLQPVEGSPKTRVRPAVVTVFAVLNILFGVLGLLCPAVLVLLLLLPQARPLAGILRQGGSDAVTVVSSVLGLVFSCVQLASGIGLLKMERWGRTAGIVYAVYSLVAAVVSLALFAFSSMPGINRFAHGAGEGERTFVTLGVVGAVGVSLCLAVYPLALLIFLMLRSTRAAFEGAGAAAATSS